MESRTLNLFDKPAEPKPKPDYMAEIKLRIEKLTTERTFIESNGSNRTERIIYTGPLTCTHELFDKVGYEYKCREPNCPGIITEKQLNPR